MPDMGPPRALPDSPDELVRRAPELEALPVVAQRLLAIARDPHTTVVRIADMLGTDQALASDVLRYANAAHGMSQRRTVNLCEAVTRIGQRTLCAVVVRACAAPMLDRGLPPYALPRRIAWRHAATTSLAARRLARLLQAGPTEEAGIAGLLHDVGKTVLTSVVPEAAAEAVSIARSRRLPVWQAEELVFGFHHGAVGAALLRSWGLPDAVTDAVAFHHQPAETSNSLAAVVYLADAAADAVGAVGGGGACPSPLWDAARAQALGATPEQIQSFLDTLRCVDEGDV
jgi:putative nucleotidyltransferase with HDIG domain